MNILFFFELPIIPYVGGVQRVTDNLTREFTRRGHNVIFLCPYPQDINTDNFCNFSAPQYYINFDNTVDAKNHVKRVLKDCCINIIINQFTFENLENSLFLFECADVNVKKISCYHNDPYYFRNKEVRMAQSLKPINLKGFISKYFRIIFPSTYRYLKTKKFQEKYVKILNVSDYLCFLSEKFIPEFIEITKLSDENKKKIIAVNNPNTFEVSPIVEKECNKENTILYVARLENPQKRPMDFVKVWQHLYRKNPEWKAIVVGTGSELNKMKRYVKIHKIRNIYFEGQQVNVESYFKKAKIIGLTSNHEGWGMTLVEGMAYGCIPIAYDTYSSIHDIIDNRVSGIISKPFSTKDMAVNIQYLIENKAELEIFSSKAKAKVDKFSVDIIANRWDYIFK